MTTDSPFDGLDLGPDVVAAVVIGVRFKDHQIMTLRCDRCNTRYPVMPSTGIRVGALPADQRPPIRCLPCLGLPAGLGPSEALAAFQQLIAAHPEAAHAVVTGTHALKRPTK